MAGFRKHIGILSVLGLAASCGTPPTGSAATSTGGLPAGGARIPAGYVATASGYKHASCVLTLAPGDSIVDRGDQGSDVQNADGTVRRVLPCPYPALSSDGRVMASSEGQVMASSDPAEQAASPRLGESDLRPADTSFFPAREEATSVAPIQALFSVWNVPGFRANENGNDISQIDLWPGLEDASPSHWVLQPVMEVFAESSWVIEPVYNNLGNQITGQSITVDEGDTIVGSATGSNCNASTGICSTWTVQVGDETKRTSTPPLVINGFGSVAKRVIAAVLELHTSPFDVTSCLSLPSNPLPNFVTSWEGFDGNWNNPPYSIVRNAQSPDCLYDAWPAPNAGTNSVYLGWTTGYPPYGQAFDDGDTRGYVTVPDWAPNQYKAECGVNDWVIGLSASPETGRAHSALCSYQGNVNSKLLNPAWTTAVDFSTTTTNRDGSVADWDYGFFKGECATNEAVTGVAQTTDGKLTKVLCTRMYDRKVSGACYPRIFETGENRGNTTGTTDWAFGYYKGQCDSPTSTTVVKGVSRVTSTGQAHAILCCPTAPFVPTL
jgi:hypothetical protein